MSVHLKEDGRFEIQLSIGPADPMMRLRREEAKEDLQRGEAYRKRTQAILTEGKR